MIDCIVVGAGGFIGAVCRYLIGMIPLKEGCTFPIKTFMINIAGSFLIGIVAALAMRTESLDSRTVLFLKVGICGGLYYIFLLRIGDDRFDERREDASGDHLYRIQCYAWGIGCIRRPGNCGKGIRGR